MHGLGLKVGALTAISAQLFAVCNEVPWHAAAGTQLVVDLMSGEVGFGSEGSARDHHPLIVVPCGSIIATLRERLLLEDDQQGHLPFPLTGLPSRIDEAEPPASREETA